MKILFLSHCVPYPPNKGDKLRAYHLLQQLGRAHDVHLLALAKEAQDHEYAAQLAGVCSEVETFSVDHAGAPFRSAAALFGSNPLTLAYFHSSELAERVRELARGTSFDAVVAYSSAMAPYAELMEGVPRVLDMVDVDSAKWAQYSRFTRPPMRWIYALEAGRLKGYERRMSDVFDRITVCTTREREILDMLQPPVSAATVPNGVCSEFFHPLELPKSVSPLLVFTGQMDYFPNVDGVCHFAERVFPRLRERIPDVEFVIVGRSPSTQVLKLGSLPGVNVTGAVGDVRPFLSRAWIFVAPLRIAQGLQNKVLEAMACELPVVCTSPVAAGLTDGQFRDGTDWLVARDDETFERAVTALIADEKLRRRMGRSSRRRALRAFDWAHSARRFEKHVARAAGYPSLPALRAELGSEEEGGERAVGAMPEDVDSRQLVPFFAGEPAPSSDRLILFAEDAIDS